MYISLSVTDNMNMVFCYMEAHILLFDTRKPGAVWLPICILFNFFLFFFIAFTLLQSAAIKISISTHTFSRSLTAATPILYSGQCHAQDARTSSCNFFWWYGGR